MIEPEIRAILLDELGAIAPEIDFAQADPSQPLRDDFEIDSMDFQNLVIALCERLSIDIPERDYARMRTIDATVAYLEARRAQSGETP